MLCWWRVQGYRDGLGCHPCRRPEAGEPEDFAGPRSLGGADRTRGVPSHRCHGPVGQGLIWAEGQRKVEGGERARAMEWLSRSRGKRRLARDGSFPAALRRIAETLARAGQ